MLAPGLPVVVSRTWQVMKGRVDMLGERCAERAESRLEEESRKVIKRKDKQSRYVGFMYLRFDMRARAMMSDLADAFTFTFSTK